MGKRNDDANMLNLVWSNSPGLELGSPYVLITPKGSMLNEWKNCVLIRKGTNISIYINGVLEQKNVSSMTPNINNSANLSFGARYYYSQTGQHFKGSIDDIGIWNRALSEEEIRILYSSEQLNQTKISLELYYKIVYEGENDNPYSSFEDYLASTKKEKEFKSQNITNEWKQQGTNQFVIPNSVLEISSALDQRNDTLEKITYLNDLISYVKNKSTNERTDWDLSMCLASFYYKLYFILPDRYNDPRISQDEWISLNNFLNNLGDDAYKNGTDKNMRGCFLYWSIFVRQKLGESYIDIKLHKMVVNEFTKDDFPMGKGFYNECKNIVDGTNNSSDSKNTKITNTKPIETSNSSSPLLLSKQPIGTIWSKKNSSIYSKYNVAQLKKTGKSTYEFKWRNSEDEVNTMMLLVKSQTLNPHSASYLCEDRYMYSMEEINSSLSWKVDFFYGNDIFGWCCSIILYDELGKKINEWGLTRE